MIFFHPEYKIEIDTDIFDLKIAIKDLNDIYKKIPDTKCLHCPGKDKVEADCCKCFSPPMLLIEFLNILTKEQAKSAKVVYQIYETFFPKFCVFYEQEDK